MKELIEKLVSVQSKLNAPKNQFNSFGKYKYRSCEDILEGVKPLLAEFGLYQSITDEIIMVGDRYYIKATVTIYDGVSEMSNSALARECVSKKGMDDAQLTGSVSSYARKYALSGIYAIDDSKDADTDEHTNQQSNAPEPKHVGKPWYKDFDNHKAQMVAKIVAKDSTAEEIIANLCKTFRVDNGTREKIRGLK